MASLASLARNKEKNIIESELRNSGITRPAGFTPRCQEETSVTAGEYTTKIAKGTKGKWGGEDVRAGGEATDFADCADGNFEYSVELWSTPGVIPTCPPLPWRRWSLSRDLGGAPLGAAAALFKYRQSPKDIRGGSDGTTDLTPRCEEAKKILLESARPLAGRHYSRALQCVCGWGRVTLF